MSDKKTTNQDIAIVGMSVFSPAGDSVEEFWQGISQGKDFITDAPSDIIDPYHFEGTPNGVDRFYCKRGGFSKAFKVDPLRYGILPVAADGIEPDQLISMAGAEQALADAGVFEKEISLKKGSIIIGKGNFSGVVPLRSLEIIRMARQFTSLLKTTLPELKDEDLEKVKEAYQGKQGRYQADMAIGTMPNLVASLVANKFDMQGPAYTVDAACASGIVAINHSMELLRSGECDIAVAGGMHSAHSAMFWGAFDMLGAMSRKQKIAPFSEDADGLLVGQGGGFVVLKTLKKAQEDGDKIYAVIKESAICSDGAGTHVTVTSVEGQVRVLEKAWGKAGMNPEELGYIEAHGTATVVGDKTEITTLKTFFGDNNHKKAYVGSVKSNIGHAMPAAGMIGVIKAALSLYHKKIPPTLHCENPLPEMFESRFMPPQELMDWKASELPLVAGVNAFGFGGINAHAILTAYEAPADAKPQRKKPYFGEALMISAKSNGQLIEKIKKGDYTNTGGNYRLVIFDPTEDRIERAISIIEKGKTWHSRFDIWYSNNPMLLNGGKIAFMFPGFNPNWESETISLSDSFDLPSMEEFIGTPATSTNEFVSALDINKETDRASILADHINAVTTQSLDKLNIEADMYLGHSIGEWQAVRYAQMVEGNGNKMVEIMRDWDELVDYPLIAVSGVGLEKAEQWCNEIPELYMANDNCPNQVLFSGKHDAVEKLCSLLDQQSIFYTQMPISVGWHTPLIAGSMDKNKEFLEHVEVKKGKAPVWSSATLECIPHEKEKYVELVSEQLFKPVYFRGLIEKLYKEENARIFIQIGRGPLTNFVEDTLKGKDFGAIEANVSMRDGADQLRRVQALLFVEGKEIDPTFLGVKPAYQVDNSLFVIPRGAPSIITDLPELKEAVAQRYGEDGFTTLSEASLNKEHQMPIPAMLQDNIRDAVKVQKEIEQLFEKRIQASGGKERAAVPSRSVTKTKETRNLAPFEEPLSLDFKDHPYLVDHSIVRQPKWWDNQEDLNLVVPFTMTIELLSEIAKKRMPGKKLIKIRNVAAYQWIGLEKPFDETVAGKWLSEDTISLQLGSYAKAEFVFADQWPAQPKEYVGKIDIGESIMKPYTSEEFYDLFSFHGPQYHSCKEVSKVASRGMLTSAEKREGKGSLLDIMGQQLGLFLHLTAKKNTISFPVRLKEMDLYEDIFDQQGTFEHTLQITRMSESVIAGNMILKRGGKVWSVAKDFVCQRFENQLPVWYVILKPQKNILAEQLEPGVFMFNNTNQENILGLLSKRYLNEQDRQMSESLESSKLQRQFLISRIALKDAVRHHIAADKEDMIYPIEIFSEHDEQGKPVVRGHEMSRDKADNYHVSIAHKENIGVAMVADHAVGIDIEFIEEKNADFLNAAFTDKERAILQKLGNQPEDIIRFWVAKEASAKKAGTGFKGQPQKFEVTKVENNNLYVNDDCVKTSVVEGKYVVGWTI
ncbi:beta-ketoacyl synthase [Listeria grandensis FSL F6-0971]|uniref:Beta-ketoacyl synthase n=1 Tax=Listeria grandensis FSL F6-0971 TaxID=1265819 RepID=W7BSN0_9LIST|nr:type I polyketide synthase [Listeria grandensis]EUJ23298.1 beta-ketoacyl synthase [Listeria grandensis FSL F6-0971]